MPYQMEGLSLAMFCQYIAVRDLIAVGDLSNSPLLEI
jgi:hypothetical protein